VQCTNIDEDCQVVSERDQGQTDTWWILWPTVSALWLHRLLEEYFTVSLSN